MPIKKKATKKKTSKKKAIKSGYTPDEAKEYSKAYGKARKTREGSSKALHGGTVADKAGKAAVKALRVKRK